MGAVPRRSRVYALILATLTALGLALTFPERGAWTDERVVTAVILFGMILLAEFFDIPFAGAFAFGVSVGAALALAAGLEFGAFHGALVVMLAHLAESLYARRNPFRATVNIANYGLSTITSAMVYQLVANPHDSPLGGLRNMAAVILAALVFIAVNTGSLTVIVAPVLGTTPQVMWRQNFGGIVVELITLPALGSLVPVLIDETPYALSILVLPLIGPHFAVKAMRQVQEETRVAMEGLADALERRDPYTYQHSMRVTDYVRAMLDEMPHVSYDAGEAIVAAARIHDLGKLGIPDLALRKPGPLTPDERSAIQEHPAIGAEIVGRLEMYRACSGIVRHHHERWDGTGYPDGLRGEEIPLGARVIAVADSFDAMTSDRAYRRAMSEAAALAELRRQSERQFDPQVVAAFERALASPVSSTEARLSTAHAR